MENLIIILALIGFAFLLLVATARSVYVILSRRHCCDICFAHPVPSADTWRHFYFYTISFISLMISVVGTVLVVRFVLQKLTDTTSHAGETGWLITGLSFVIVGVPSWLVHWKLLHRQFQGVMVERRSLIRKIYLYLVLAVSMTVTLPAAVTLLEWAFHSRQFGNYQLAVLTIWPVVWVFHWHIEVGEGQQTDATRDIRRLYLYLMSLITISTMSVGAGRTLYLILIESYEAVSGLSLLLPLGSTLWRPELRDSLALTLVTGIAWSVHWFRFSGTDAHSVIRQIYIYLFLSFGGAVTMIIGIGLAVYAVLVWSVSAQGTVITSQHFRVIPGALTLFLVGFGLWAYHRDKARSESAGDVNSIGRIYDYLLVLCGVALAAIGVVYLVHLLLSSIADLGKELIIDNTIRGRHIALIATLSILAVPILTYNWMGVQRRSNKNVSEQTSFVREAFMKLILASGTLTGLGGMITVAFIFLRDFLSGELSLNTLLDSKTALGMIITISVGLPYFFLVYKSDRVPKLDKEPNIVGQKKR